MIRRLSHQAFSLIELSISMAVIAILASSIIPIAIRSLQIKAGEKTALEMAMIQEASRNYFIDHSAWPVDIPALQAQGYLNSSWSASNPWHNPYSISSTSLELTVNTDLPLAWTNLVASHLPAAVINNTTVSSTISSLGGTVLASGVIVAWSGTIASIPKGWALCDGSKGTPDLRDKFIVGARQDSSGAAKTNITGSLTQSGGSTTIAQANLPAVGLTFSIPLYSPNNGGISGNPQNTPGAADSNSKTYTTSNLGSGAAYTQPYYALAFIMKL